MPDYISLYFEYELEFGGEMAQSLLFAGEELSVEEVICNKLAAEYLRSPDKNT